MGFFSTHDMFKAEVSKSDKLHTLTNDEQIELKKMLLEMIKDIDALSEKNKIKYTLGGGTALGAVRHGGFIPWDDDVDINIERKYVDILVRKINAEFSWKYKVITPGRTKGYESVFYQIQRRGTIFKESESLPDDLSGVKIDMFVLENTFNNRFIRVLHGVMTDLWLFFMSCVRFYERKNEYMGLAEGNLKAEIIIKIKGIVGRLLYKYKSKIYIDLLRIVRACKDNRSEYVTFPSGRKHFFGELTKRSKYTEYVRINFEDTMLPVTADYDNYLKRLFGDYMSMPDEEKRERHLIYSIKLG